MKTEAFNQGITHETLQTPFRTEAGVVFNDAPVAYKTWGTLNTSRDNVILIFHALTGHAAANEWFSGIFGEGKLCDPSQNFIICINVPGSPYGSLNPWTVNPATGSPYRNDFPLITVRDMVRFQQQLLDQLDVSGIDTVVGGSLGGMQALEFCLMDNRAKSALLIAMGKAHSPWAIGISHAQRAAITSDPEWKSGNYVKGEGPVNGLAAARMMAMITYRTPSDYEKKFGRNLQNQNGQFQIESYLNYQGQKLAGRFDAHCYLSLTKTMDSHDIARERGSYAEVLNQINIPAYVIGIDSDLLYPVNEQKELAAMLPGGEYHEIRSAYGHDAFLIEFSQMNTIIEKFQRKNKKTSN
ncbi:MAG: homoserine O-acetyltransferase [Balneolaceae bacterium]|nr:MAG: homoserine O-acetyltransferase [Balneolaceae bacterium]